MTFSLPRTPFPACHRGWWGDSGRAVRSCSYPLAVGCPACVHACHKRLLAIKHCTVSDHSFLIRGSLQGESPYSAGGDATCWPLCAVAVGVCPHASWTSTPHARGD